MLKKGVTLVKFTRPESIMRRVLLLVRDKHQTWFTAKQATGLKKSQVQRALSNLVYSGAIVRVPRKNKCSIYRLNKDAEC